MFIKNLLIAIGVAIILSLLFSPSEAITVLYQAFFLMMVIIKTVLSGVGVVIASIGIVFGGFGLALLNYILGTEFTPQIFNDFQSAWLGGVNQLFSAIMGFVADFSSINAQLFNLNIQFSSTQSWDEAINITINSIRVAIGNSVDGVSEAVQWILDRFAGGEHVPNMILEGGF